MTRLYKPLERRTCIIPNTEALISKLDGLKSPCIVKYVKASAVFEPFKVNLKMKIKAQQMTFRQDIIKI